ncbi:MAG: transposase [Alphaproteobacteria bacterium]|nr:transposase [Alphaproteobacteria bacterium]
MPWTETIISGSALRLAITPDRGYDVIDFVETLRQMEVTLDTARNDYVTRSGRRRRSNVDERTTRHPGYEISQRQRKRIEEPFGWAKMIGGLRHVMVRGQARVEHHFTLQMIACNLIRLPKLLGQAP